jgi:hypothetical protein
MSYFYSSNHEQFKALPKDIQQKLIATHPRQEITQREHVSSSDMLDVIADAKEFAKKWGKTIEDVSLENYVEQEYESHYSRLDFNVRGLETDEQYFSRLFDTHHRDEIRAEYDRNEYERLKAKFDKK